MRQELANRNGLRGRFTAVYVERRQHTRGGHPVTRCLFATVCDERGTMVTDHIHFDLAAWNKDLKPGERITFDARVRAYWKGYHDNRRRDYRLSHPTKVRKLESSSANHDQLLLM